MSERVPLEQLLRDFREEAAILRAHGHRTQAATLDRVLDAVSESASPYLEFLTETEGSLMRIEEHGLELTGAPDEPHPEDSCRP